MWLTMKGFLFNRFYNSSSSKIMGHTYNFRKNTCRDFSELQRTKHHLFHRCSVWSRKQEKAKKESNLHNTGRPTFGKSRHSDYFLNVHKFINESKFIMQAQLACINIVVLWFIRKFIFKKLINGELVNMCPILSLLTLEVKYNTLSININSWFWAVAMGCSQFQNLGLSMK